MRFAVYSPTAVADKDPKTVGVEHRKDGLRLGRLLRPHWKPLVIALVAVIGEAVADIAEPWPVTIVVDSVLGAKKPPQRLDRAITLIFGTNTTAILEFALTAVIVVAIVGGISAYIEKYLTTSVSQWVAHDMRLLLYQRIQRLSLAEHGRTRAGDLLTRVTKDIDAVQDFIDTALLGIVVNIATLVGMVGVMLWINWRFTLIGLSIAPPLGLFVYLLPAASRKHRGSSRRRKAS